MRRTWVVVIGAVVLVLPFLGVDDYYLHLLIMAGLFYLLAAGMNLLLAAGQLNLGHTAFFGIGAYTSGLLAVHYGISPLWTLPTAAACLRAARRVLRMTFPRKPDSFELEVSRFLGLP